MVWMYMCMYLCTGLGVRHLNSLGLLKIKPKVGPFRDIKIVGCTVVQYLQKVTF